MSIYFYVSCAHDVEADSTDFKVSPFSTVAEMPLELSEFTIEVFHISLSHYDDGVISLKPLSLRFRRGISSHQNSFRVWFLQRDALLFRLHDYFNGISDLAWGR